MFKLETEIISSTRFNRIRSKMSSNELYIVKGMEKENFDGLLNMVRFNKE